MKTKMNNKFKYGGVFAAAVLVATGVSLLTVSPSYAWGPDRTTYSNAKPADHVVFNSITDNAGIGDERNFVRVKEVGTDAKYRDEVKVEAGKEYEVYIYFHNNAAANLNASGKGIANGARVSSQFQPTVSASSKSKISAVISATDATPREVWDEAYLTTDSKSAIKLHYKEASAIFHNAYKANGTVMSEALFSSKGTYIGANKLDGWLPGCAEYSGYITYILVAEKTGGEVKKTVSLDGKTFAESVAVKPGDTVTYKVEFANVGNTDLKEVTFRDALPKGVTLVSGSTILTNNAHPNGQKLVDDIGKAGFNTGLYGQKTKATLVYQVKLNGDIVANGNCGVNAFKNTIFVDYEGGEISASSTINVTRVCTPEEEEKQKQETPTSLPKTGPAEVALAVVAAVCLTAGGIYWYRSQKEVTKLQKSLGGQDKGEKPQDKIK